MTDARPTSLSSKRRRRPTVDIYFVLYLTAVVLLLGTVPFAQDEERNELEETVLALLDAEFALEVDRVGLFVPIDGPDVERVGLLADTINAVRAVGDVDDVSFSILSITDSAGRFPEARERGRLVRTSPTSVQFRWLRKSEDRRGHFIVHVEGSAMPVIPESISDRRIRSRIAQVLESRGRLRDTATFLVNVLPPSELIAARTGNAAPVLRDPESDTANRLSALARLLRTPLTGGIVAVPQRPTIYATRDGRWQQFIAIGGENPRNVRVTGPEDVATLTRNDQGIAIAGKAPVIGERRKVSLLLTSESGESTSIEFWVETRDIGTRGTPKTLVVNAPYEIDIGQNDVVADDRIAVSVYENGDLRLANRPARFTYTPTRTGQGYFEVMIDGQVHETRPFSIEPIPDPMIRLVTARDESGAIILETVTKGYVEGSPNRARVEIARNQNADDPRQIGRSSFDHETMTMTERWRIDRRNPDDTDETVVEVWDQRGRSVKRTMKIADPAR